jgi:hypothetical protein
MLLNLSKQILDEVDMAVREQRHARQAIERNLNHYRRVERQLFMHMQQKGMS